MGHVVQNYTPIENLSFDFIYIYIYICQCVIPCICMSIIKNNHNYMVQIITFFRRGSNYTWY